MPSAVLNIEPEHLTGTLSRNVNLIGGLSSAGQTLMGIVEKNATRIDYNQLANKPQINSVTLQGNMSAQDLGLGQIYYDTTSNWNRQPDLIAEQAAIYIYSDYHTFYDEVGNPIIIAGVKIGDGSSYLIDMPFITDEMTSMLLKHITNTDVHLTTAEREFWNNKISCYLDGNNVENLVFSKSNFIVEGDILYG